MIEEIEDRDQKQKKVALNIRLFFKETLLYAKVLIKFLLKHCALSIDKTENYIVR